MVLVPRAAPIPCWGNPNKKGNTEKGEKEKEKGTEKRREGKRKETITVLVQ
jgi:hypothetical protein